jgi:hypothetical protein
VLAWRGQFEKDGLIGFGEVAKGRGRKPSISDEKVAEIVDLTLHSKPEGRDALVVPVDGQTGRGELGIGAADLVGARAQASPGEDIQTLQ